MTNANCSNLLDSRPKVALGSRVTIRLAGGSNYVFTISSQTAAPERGIIFVESPLGSALLGRAVGEKISYQVGDRELEALVVEVSSQGP